MNDLSAKEGAVTEPDDNVLPGRELLDAMPTASPIGSCLSDGKFCGFGLLPIYYLT